MKYVFRIKSQRNQVKRVITFAASQALTNEKGAKGIEYGTSVYSASQ